MSFNLNERAVTVADIARQAGAIAQQHRRQGLEIDNKGVQDFVTQADRAVESLISDQLLAHYPEEGIFGEEHQPRNSDAGTWVIDPIDGTTNYIKGMDYWCISIAFVYNNEILLGCVYAPDKDALYLAIKDQGVTLNGKKLAKLADVSPHKAVIGIGRSNRCEFSGYLAAVEFLHQQSIDYRRFGSAALTLAQVASAEVDGYYEAHLNSWDACAGWLIASEAGANCAQFMTDGALEKGNRALVSNSTFFEQLDAHCV